MKKILAIAIATAISAPAMADLTLSANIETNTTLSDVAGSEVAQAGRVEIAIAGGATAENGNFVAAKATLEQGLDGNRAGTDTYIQVGTPAANVKLGYVRSAEIWANGGDIIAEGASSTISGYTGTAQRTRAATNMILGLTAIEGVSIEAQVTPESNGDLNTRLTASATVGGVNLGVAVEDDAANANADSGWVVNANMDGYGVSYARAEDDDSSLALYGSVAGFNLGYQINQEDAANTDEKVYFVAYPMADFMGVSGLTATVGASGSDADGAASRSDARVRFNYAF